jgi:hypothetical protein
VAKKMHLRTIGFFLMGKNYDLKCSACQNEIEFNIDYFPHLSSGLMADK